MTLHLGNVAAGSILYIPFHTFDSNGASITLTGLAVTDIEIYKNGSVTQRSSDNGYALLDTDGIDFDGITGIHGFSIDLSDNTDAGFYAAGSFYWVVISAVTIDTRTVNFIAATFFIGALASQASVDTIDDFLDTEIAAIKAKTDNLPSDPADDSDIDSQLASIATKVDTIDDFLDTEIAAIKAKTDNLPADPADASDIAGAFTTLSGKVDTIDDFLDTEIAAIKAKTDSLTFTDAGKVDATIQAAADLKAAVANRIADHVLRRTYANVRASSDGDAVAFRSLLGAVSKLVNKWYFDTGELKLTHEDDSTVFGSQAVTTDGSAEPITELDTG
jgi:uncharacterized protein YunC (DUF1805 family)